MDTEAPPRSGCRTGDFARADEYGDSNSSLDLNECLIASSFSSEDEFTDDLIPSSSAGDSSPGLDDGPRLGAVRGTSGYPHQSALSSISGPESASNTDLDTHHPGNPATSLLGSTSSNGAGAAAGAGAGTGVNGSMRSWLMFAVFALIQILLSSPHPSNGVNAKSDQVSNTESSNGGSGNSAHRGGSHGGVDVNSRQYFRTLPPIIDVSKAPGMIVTKRMTESRRKILRQEAKDMFLHGYQGYLNYAFPKDELNPVACTGRGPDTRNPNNINVNDVLGDFSLTLIDALDTLAAMREPELFQIAIKLVKRHVFDFNIDSRVQVFEVNIRVLGALLSGHLYASDPSFKSIVKGYKGELLTMAKDLGARLIKAFDNTPTGIPWPRVNLRRGVLREESSETCVAGAGSLLLEFGVLSRLTGDPSFENAAKKALFELWNRRSNLGLVGNTINITSGEWMSLMTGIGAGTDSFYEYLLKSYVLFGDSEYLDMYETAQDAIKRHLLHDSKYFYKHVHLHDGSLLATWVDSLSAFMPGVQVLGGDLESAIKNHLYYYNIWRKFQAIPERFNFVTQTVDISNYPLRPEFIESNYFLYRATKDPFYLEVGEMILHDLQSYTRTKCGWASLKSVIDKKLEDRMESFALSETFKYLFLLFDEENVLHQELKDSNFVFTTEGHVLALGSKYLQNGHQNKKTADEDLWMAMSSEQQLRLKSAGGQQKIKELLPSSLYASTKKQRWPQCPVYRAPDTFLKSIPYRSDADFARQMVGTRPDARDLLELDPKGFCDKPSLEVERVLVEFSGPPKKTYLGNGGHGHTISPPSHKESAEDRRRREQQEGESMNKKLVVIPIKKGVFVNRIVGVQMQLQYDGTQNAYRAVKVADHPLSLNSNVYVDRSSMRPLWDSYQLSQDAHLRIYKAIGRVDAPSAAPTVTERDLSIKPAEFGYWQPFVVDYTQDRQLTNPFETTLGDEGRDTSSASSPSGNTSQGQIDTAKLVRVKENVSGCRPYTSSQSMRIRDNILVVDRGGCLFILKAYYAQVAGARSVVIINSDEETFTMGGGPEQLAADTSSSSNQNARVSPPPKSNQIGEGIIDDDIDIQSVMVGFSEGQILLDWIREVEAYRGDTPATLVGGFVLRKITKEQIDNARLSYNSLPIVNIHTMPTAMATYG
ncbi:ER degradation enhancer, mannosidase alpha-like 1 [Entomortierella parvispora]|uniref:alpha-1,2-Mannosidase n=1 Tax=Entomortierella parvispora TaxID=205924 RepID=A0A9P3HHB9_9FUNG|nr:ER degradation enhancer, mannosidase alpha-like 1 [Entomortierella parvispora]